MILKMADMSSKASKRKLVVVLIISLWFGLVSFYSLSKPISNGCVMTYMYPTYIPIPMPEKVASMKYGLYLYHEGWRKIDFNDHIKKLTGVPVLFIPGNGGSYKQVRSLGAESDRAYHDGPLESNLYRASKSSVEGVDVDLNNISLPSKYNTMLDWFTVDLEGEHSAFDSRIIQEHSEYVVSAIHRILDQYKESFDARRKEGVSVVGRPPESVILVGHSMGGFVARAAVVHPNLRKHSVETILTLSTPHQSPPVAFQPSLAHYYAQVNQEWRKGYKDRICETGQYPSDPVLSHVIVVSISGGYNDYQVRTKLESLDGIVPDTHGFMISSMSMKNVWLSMEHQVILWCNQLVVQVSHTLLSLIDMKTGQATNRAQKRLQIFFKMLQNGIPKSFISLSQPHVAQKTDNISNNVQVTPGVRFSYAPTCQNSVQWSEDALERDLYIQTKTLIILAMDGRRRWLDIDKLDPSRKSHFVFFTNLSPCSGVRLHLWPGRNDSDSNSFSNIGAIDITSKMVQIPSGPSPRQIEPGSQTEQAPPSAVFWLDPHDMDGFSFLTISVAHLFVSGGPPPAASMGIGQFFEPKGGIQISSPGLLFQSLYSEKHWNMKENHPLAVNIIFSATIGLLPLSLSLTTMGCGIKKSDYVLEESGDLEVNKLCRVRCFPPLALAWDATSGLHVFPNLHSQTLVVDSSPALLTSSQETDETSLLLIADPHCSYEATLGIPLSSAAGRFLLLFFPRIWGLCFAAIFFSLMRQSHALYIDNPIPSVLSAIESNFRTTSLFFLAVMPIALILLIPFLISHSPPPAVSFSIVTILCYVVANGIVVVLTLLSQLLFAVTGNFHVSMKKRWRLLEGKLSSPVVRWSIHFCYKFVSVKVIRTLQVNALHFTPLVAIVLSCLIHPALGLFALLLSHASRCHTALSRHYNDEQLYASRIESDRDNVNDTKGTASPESGRSCYHIRQVEVFRIQHGLLVLHLLGFFMFLPSLVARLQRTGTGKSLPAFEDSALCIGTILHGLSYSIPESAFRIEVVPRWEMRSRVACYLVAGYFSYMCAVASAPYRVFYPTAAIGIVSLSCRIMETRHRNRAEIRHRSKRHSL